MPTPKELAQIISTQFSTKLSEISTQTQSGTLGSSEKITAFSTVFNAHLTQIQALNEKEKKGFFRELTPRLITQLRHPIDAEYELKSSSRVGNLVNTMIETIESNSVLASEEKNALVADKDKLLFISQIHKLKTLFSPTGINKIKADGSFEQFDFAANNASKDFAKTLLANVFGEDSYGQLFDNPIFSSAEYLTAKTHLSNPSKISPFKKNYVIPVDGTEPVRVNYNDGKFYCNGTELNLSPRDAGLNLSDALSEIAGQKTRDDSLLYSSVISQALATSVYENINHSIQNILHQQIPSTNAAIEGVPTCNTSALDKYDACLKLYNLHQEVSNMIKHFRTLPTGGNFEYKGKKYNIPADSFKPFIQERNDDLKPQRRKNEAMLVQLSNAAIGEAQASKEGLRFKINAIDGVQNLKAQLGIDDSEIAKIVVYRKKDTNTFNFEIHGKDNHITLFKTNDGTNFEEVKDFTPKKISDSAEVLPFDKLTQAKEYFVSSSKKMDSYIEKIGATTSEIKQKDHKRGLKMQQRPAAVTEHTQGAVQVTEKSTPRTAPQGPNHGM